MKLAWAFFRRDASIALSYRVAFAAQLLGNFLLVGLLYYVSKTVGLENVPSLAEYGGNFLAFALIGIALTDCVLVSLVGFAQQVRESQTTGTLEATLISPVPLPLILIYSSLWGYFLSAVRFLLYVAAGTALGGLHTEQMNGPACLLIFFLTVVCFLGVGILWAGIVLLVKRGESIMGILSIMVMLVSGMLFPVKMLPKWIQYVSEVIPLTAALDGMRKALINHAGFDELGSILVRLTVFAAILLALGLGSFHYAVQLGRKQGSLTQY